MPAFLVSHRDLRLPLSQNYRPNYQTQIVGFYLRVLPSVSDRKTFSINLFFTGSTIQLNIHYYTACCLQKYNFRHIFVF